MRGETKRSGPASGHGPAKTDKEHGPRRRAACLARWLAVAASLTAAGAHAQLLPGGPCRDSIDPDSQVLANGFASDLRNTRNPDSAIDAGNVANLELAMSHVAPGVTEKRGAPAVTEQAIFLSAGNRVIAINRESGCRYWAHSLPRRYRWLSPTNAVRSSAVYYLQGDGQQPPLVLVGDALGHFHALDARDGEVVWSRFLGTDEGHHWITGAPQFHDGKLLVPVSSREVLSSLYELLQRCCTSHGILRALDPYSGETIWSYHTTAEASYHPQTRQMAPSGATIWSVPAVDPERSAVYIGTGQNLSRPATETSDAIIALDLDSGQQKWVFQSTSNDAWNTICHVAPRLGPGCNLPAGGDYDFGAPPILVERDNGQDMIVAGAKNGVVYSLDPDTGARNWSQRIGTGGSLGGIHWGMAVDGERVYAAVADATVSKATGVGLGGEDPGIQPVENARSGIYALNLDNGQVAWERHPEHEHDGQMVTSIHSAALTVTNDVLFAGSLDGMVRALRTSDGQTLWQHDTAQPVRGVNGPRGNGGEIDSVGAIVAGGDVLVNSGYDTFGSENAYQAGPGNALMIFRLPAR